MSAGFELTEHTADVGIRAWGASAADVFEQAALAMASLLYATIGVNANERVEIEVDAPDAELLLAAWLNEVLFVVESRHLLFARFEVIDVGPAEPTTAEAGPSGLADRREATRPWRDSGGAPHDAAGGLRDAVNGPYGAVGGQGAAVPWRVRAAGVGEALDARRHTYHPLVKAATLHQLALERTADGWEGRVLLDV
jgi:SHS2 domain-containing protein